MSGEVGGEVALAWLLEPWAEGQVAEGVRVGGISVDSRSLVPGEVFAAVGGVVGHGADYIAHAVERGAAAVLVDPAERERLVTTSALQLPAVISVPELGRRVGEIAARFYAYPSHSLEVVAVTGTDGKSSVTHFVAQLLGEPQAPWGIIGTTGYGLPGNLQPAALTTPHSVELQRIFAQLRAANCCGVALEASSHALQQGRLNGAEIDVAVLTHLGRDHLDYHGSREAYADAKTRLFEFASLRAQVLNSDDEFGQRLQQRAGGAVFSYSLSTPQADVYAESVEPCEDGIEITLGVGRTRHRTRLPLIGRFNAANALAAVGAALALGRPLDEVIARLASLRPVPGRMERYSYPGKPLVVVDYAHTPGALRGALAAVREHCRGRLSVVFGCGGERDPGKRFPMGEIAAQLADQAIITDDNPRHEDSEQIRQTIAAGFAHIVGSLPLIEPARDKAIEQAIGAAGPADTVLIAGKGHEEVQQIGSRFLPCSDRHTVLRALDREGSD